MFDCELDATTRPGQGTVARRDDHPEKYRPGGGSGAGAKIVAGKFSAQSTAAQAAFDAGVGSATVYQRQGAGRGGAGLFVFDAAGAAFGRGVMATKLSHAGQWIAGMPRATLIALLRFYQVVLSPIKFALL